MKKLLLLFLGGGVLLFLIGCSSTSGLVKTQQDDGFITTSDIITGNEKIQHSDFELGAFYNLRDSITGERENIAACITDNTLVISANYQYNQWLFINEVIFIDTDTNTRLALPGGISDTEVVAGNVLRESYTVSVNNSDLATLRQIINGAPQVCFIGTKGRTDLLKIKPKQINAFNLTLDKLN